MCDVIIFQFTFFEGYHANIFPERSHPNFSMIRKALIAHWIVIIYNKRTGIISHAHLLMHYTTYTSKSDLMAINYTKN